MVNPVTSFFRSMQETDASRIDRMKERVAEGSIDAQKQVDEYNVLNTFSHAYYLNGEKRLRAFNSYTCSNSYFAGRAGGIGSSFKTARYYTDQAMSRRDALMEEVAAESS
eukprot:CAMPEP_0117007306 /NCGR_PEP_ID=MMETSP0472-20121206/7229_1 /TAXON_ID=693140 ORGANISM="Tiarina fusus, Strain LIS" /NCGR_SAMPLE_ID=MMETSP0472 /ASSEMBLY_ACC=CAM_ASM_000603 /LENGTH=109 /DNA_ID=CAMNT_0004709029 /DNA_START=91 /DNA_END=420 /DNA_ORIENTATION=-